MRAVKTLTAEKAEKAGYSPCAGPYRRTHIEQSWLSNVMKDMRGAKVVIVDTALGPEVWRHESELDLLLKELRIIKNLSTHYQ